jgi:hypothetical protein
VSVASTVGVGTTFELTIPGLRSILPPSATTADPEIEPEPEPETEPDLQTDPGGAAEVATSGADADAGTGGSGADRLPTQEAHR